MNPDPRWPPLPEPGRYPGTVKHVRCEGARYHVLSYFLVNDGFKQRAETRCSEPDCEINHTPAMPGLLTNQRGLKCRDQK